MLKKIVNAFRLSWKRWWVRTLIILALIIVVLHFILEPIATYSANKYMATHIPGYYGHVHYIHLALFRGAYRIDSFELQKVDTASGERTQFASAGQIDLSIEWKSLFHKRLVGKIKLLTPELLFTKDKVEPKQVAKDTVTFRHLIDIGMPLDINRIEVEEGDLRYRDLTSKPPVDIGISDIYVLARDLKNVEDSGEALLPSSLVASADVYKGTVHVDTRLNLLKNEPTFEVKAEVKDLDLTGLNNFFMAYGKFTIDRGSFNLYSEAAAKDGAYVGYLKPLINDLHVAGPSNRDEKFINKLWEHVIDAAAWVFKNHKHDQLATKIPFAGNLGKEHTGVLYAIFAVLRNAFIEALSPSLDNEIDIESVGKKNEEKPGKLLKKNIGDKNPNSDKKLTAKEKRLKKKHEKNTNRSN